MTINLLKSWLGRPPDDGREQRSAELPPATWPSGEAQQLRVVLEGSPDERTGEVLEALQGAGFDVAVCHGPSVEAACPLVEHGSCSLIDGADAVVNMLGVADEENCEILVELQDVTPRVPVVSVMTENEERTHAGELTRAHPLCKPVAPQAVLDTVIDALEEPGTA